MTRPWRIEYRFCNSYADYASPWLRLRGNYATESSARKAAAGDLDYFLATASTSHEFRFVCVDDIRSSPAATTTTKRGTTT